VGADPNPAEETSSPNPTRAAGFELAAAAPEPGDAGTSRPIDRVRRGVTVLSDTERRISAYALDALLHDRQLLSSARIVPQARDGGTPRLLVFGIAAGSALEILGFQNGDELRAVAGYSLTSPDKALEAYQKLAQAKNLDVDIGRRGKPVKLVFHLER
jgi:type II secretory pathway component PulC